MRLGKLFFYKNIKRRKKPPRKGYIKIRYFSRKICINSIIFKYLFTKSPKKAKKRRQAQNACTPRDLCQSVTCLPANRLHREPVRKNSHTNHQKGIPVVLMCLIGLY